MRIRKSLVPSFLLFLWAWAERNNHLFYHDRIKGHITPCWKVSRNLKWETPLPHSWSHTSKLQPNYGYDETKEGKLYLGPVEQDCLGRNIWVMLVWMKPSGSGWRFWMNNRELNDSRVFPHPPSMFPNPRGCCFRGSSSFETKYHDDEHIPNGRVLLWRVWNGIIC